MPWSWGAHETAHRWTQPPPCRLLGVLGAPCLWLALALFLPLHFTFLGQALQGAAGLDGALAFTQHPLVKVAEWGLVSLLALHLAGGVRLLLLEFSAWRGLRGAWVAGAFGFATATGLAFALSLLG